MDLDPDAFLGDRAIRQARVRKRADRLLAKYAIHHRPERETSND